MSEDNKTRIIRRTQIVASDGSEKTAQAGGLPEFSDDKTRIIGQNSVSDASDSPKTKLFRPKRENSEEVKNETVDPVVGWLVITAGPGKGKSFELGIGNNSVGRDKSQKVSLDFGDAAISRENHFKAVYEPKKRKFYVAGGDSRNLAYLNDELFNNLVEIKNYDRISIGETELMFIAFCGEQFSW